MAHRLNLIDNKDMKTAKKLIEEATPQSTYLTARTLLDAGVHMYTANQVMGIVAKRTLENLVTHFNDAITDQMTGTWVPLVKQKRDGSLRFDEATVMHETLGHRLRLKAETAPNGYIIGTAIENRFDSEGYVLVRLDDGHNAKFGQDDLLNTEVSTLGQEVPQTKQEMVRAEVLRRAFPSTILPANTALEVIVGMLMEKDIVLKGEPGGGKSQLAKDLRTMVPQWMYAVEGCESNCHPYSLISSEFARIVPACPSCKDYYMQIEEVGHEKASRKKEGPFFKRQHFAFVEPDKVRVHKKPFTTLKMSGTESIRAGTLAGFKPLNLSSPDEMTASSVGAVLGFLARANNGYAIIDEIDKLQKTAVDPLLEAVGDNEISLPGVSSNLPASSAIIATANDATKLSGPINDRLLYITIPRADEMEDMMAIYDAAFHGVRNVVETIDVGDVYFASQPVLRRVPMTRIQEAALNRLFQAFRHDTGGIDRDVSADSGSVRAIVDAALATRAYNLVNNILDPERPNEVTTEDMIDGISLAFTSRVNVNGRAPEVRKHVEAFVRTNVDTFLREEGSNWWCKLKKFISVADRYAPGTEALYHEELQKLTDPTYTRKAFIAFEGLVTAANQAGLLGRNDMGVNQFVHDHPFLGYLAEKQIGFFNLKPDRAVTLVQQYKLYEE